MAFTRHVWVVSAWAAILAAPGRDTLLAQDPTARATISGSVTDSISGSPLAGARATLVELHQEITLHEDGRFTFADVVPGTYTLLVRRLGYRPVTRRITVQGTSLDLNIRMSTAAVQLEAAIVTGTLSERPRDEVLSPTSVLADEALDRRLQATLGQTLETQPGVTATSTGPTTSRPVIRGLSGDRIVLLEDGQRPGDMSSFSGDHAVAIEPLTARRIEVVRGPMSLLYGSSALGGVVNVVRNEVPQSLPEDFHAVVSAQGNSVNSGGAIGGEATTGVGPLALRLEGSGRAAGDTRTPSGPLTNTSVRTYSASAGGSLVRENGHAGAAYRFYQNDYGIPGGFVGGHEEGVDIEMRRHSTRVIGERHLSGAHLRTLQANAGFTHYYHAEREPSGSIGTEFRQYMLETDLRAQHEHSGPFSLGAFGVRGQFRDIATGGTLDTPPTRDYTIAAYVVEEITRGNARFQMGGRYDHARYEPLEEATVDVGGESVPVTARSFGSVSGSLGVLYSVRPGLRLGATLSRAYRTPDFNELYSNGPHLAANSFEVGDPRLGTEIGTGIDAFVRISGSRVNAEIAAFRNQLNGYIFPSSRGRAETGPQGNRPKFQYTNGDVVFVGADGSVGLTLTERWTLNTTVSSVFGHFTSPLPPIPVITASDTTFDPATKYPPLTPPVQGRSELRYDAPRFFAGGGLRAAAAQTRLEYFEKRTPGYAVWDFDAGMRLLTGRRLQTITLRVDNLFDREYRDHLSRIKEIMPQPGRDLSLVYRVQF